MRVLIYILSFLFLFLSDCLAYDWIPLAFDTEDAINIAVQKEVSKKEDYDSAAFKKSSVIDAQNEVNEKNRAVDQNLIKLRNTYNKEKNKRDTKKTLYDYVKNRFDKEEVKYKTAIENINKYKSQKETSKKEISLQRANLTKRLANEPVGEVVTIALYSTGWKEKKSSQEKKADILATESAIEIMMTYIDSSSMVENNILVKDTIISRKSGQAESIKQPLEQKLAAGKYLRIRSFRLYPLKKSLQRSDMDFKKQKVKAVAVLDSKMLKRFINENKIVVSDNFLKRANTLIDESRRTTVEDQKNLNNIITSQIRIINNKKNDLQDVIESIKHHEGLKKRSQENMNRLSTELKNEKARLEKRAATFKKTETAYFHAKNAFTHYVLKKNRGQIKRDKTPPEIAADILISTLHEVRDDSRRYYSDIFEQTNMGMLSVAQKGSAQVSIKITKFKLTYITESATSDDMEIGAIFEVTMGKRSERKTQLGSQESTESVAGKNREDKTIVWNHLSFEQVLNERGFGDISWNTSLETIRTKHKLVKRGYIFSNSEFGLFSGCSFYQIGKGIIKINEINKACNYQLVFDGYDKFSAVLIAFPIVPLSLKFSDEDPERRIERFIKHKHCLSRKETIKLRQFLTRKIGTHRISLGPTEFWQLGDGAIGIMYLTENLSFVIVAAGPPSRIQKLIVDEI